MQAIDTPCSDEPGSTPQADKSPAGHFRLSEIASARIVFALTFLGIIIALNPVIAHFQNVQVTYSIQRAWFFKGPYRIRLISFFYAMEILLSTATYVYGLNFLFKSHTLEIIGNYLYAATVLVPPLCINVWIYASLYGAMANINAILFYGLTTVINLTSLAFHIWAFKKIVAALVSLEGEQTEASSSSA